MMGVFALGNLISKAKVEKCGARDFPVLSMTMHDGIVFQNDRFKKDIASVDRSNYSVVNRDQLVVSFPIDEGVLAVQGITDVGIVSPAYKIWDINQDLVIPKYLELWLRAPRSIEYYKSKLRGTTARRRSIPENDFLEMPVSVPSKCVQMRAIDLVERVENILKRRNHELAMLDDLIKARFVEMFGDPVANPKAWPNKPLLDMGACKNGMNYHYDDTGIEIHCLGVGDFQDYSIIADTSVLPMVALNEMPADEYLLRDDDIVFVRSNGNKALVGRSVAVYNARRINRNRQAILDACAAVELSLVNQITTYCNSINLLPEILLDKYRYLNDRFNLVKKTSKTFPKENYKTFIVDPRNEVRVF